MKEKNWIHIIFDIFIIVTMGYLLFQFSDINNTEKMTFYNLTPLIVIFFIKFTYLFFEKITVIGIFELIMVISYMFAPILTLVAINQPTEASKVMLNDMAMILVFVGLTGVVGKNLKFLEFLKSLRK